MEADIKSAVFAVWVFTRYPPIVLLPLSLLMDGGFDRFIGCLVFFDRLREPTYEVLTLVAAQPALSRLRFSSLI
jgi:hypothetical protein